MARKSLSFLHPLYNGSLSHGIMVSGKENSSGISPGQTPICSSISICTHMSAPAVHHALSLASWLELAVTGFVPILQMRKWGTERSHVVWPRCSSCTRLPPDGSFPCGPRVTALQAPQPRCSQGLCSAACLLLVFTPCLCPAGRDPIAVALGPM